MPGNGEKVPKIAAHNADWSRIGEAGGYVTWSCTVCGQTATTKAGKQPKPERHRAIY